MNKPEAEDGKGRRRGANPGTVHRRGFPVRRTARRSISPARSSSSLASTATRRTAAANRTPRISGRRISEAARPANRRARHVDRRRFGERLKPGPAHIVGVREEAAVLGTIGELAQVGGEGAASFIPQLLVLIIDGRPWATPGTSPIVTMGQLIESTGFVIRPFNEHPGLLSLMLRVLAEETARSSGAVAERWASWEPSTPTRTGRTRNGSTARFAVHGGRPRRRARGGG